MTRTASLAFGFTFVLVACGGATESDLFGTPPGGGNDGGTSDGAVNDTGPVPDGSNCGACGAPAPAGFHYVRYQEDRNGSCPNGTTPTDVVANVSDSVACGCDCKAGVVDCNSGQVVRPFDNNSSPTCNQLGATLNASAPTCTVLANPIALQTHIQVNPPAATPSCSSEGKPKLDTIKQTEGRLCQAPDSCTGIVCGGPNKCVAQAGDVACPNGFPKKTLTGTGVSAKCEACGACKAEVTCSGTLTFFTDQGCTQGTLALAADSTCGNRPQQAVGQTYQAYTYKGAVKSSTCTPPPDTKGSTSLDGATTVCCAN